MSNPTIGFLILGPSSQHSFAPLIEYLNGKYRAVFYCQDEQLVFNGIEIIPLPVPPRLAIRWLNFFEATTLWFFRYRSPNHTIRANNLYGTRSQIRLSKSVIPNLQPVGSIKGLVVRFFGRSIIYKMVGVINNHVILPILHRMCASTFVNLDILVIPHNAHLNYAFNFFCGLARSMGLKTLALQENWDGLATKSFVMAKPDYFAVWGTQSLGHLRTIQHQNNTMAYIAGSPRFRGYSELSKNHCKGRRILLAGTGSVELDSMIFKNLSTHLNIPVNIHYRPHPERKLHELEIRELLEHKNRNSLHTLTISNAEPSYQSILESELVITHFSTLALEALCYGVPVVIPLFTDTGSYAYTFEDIFIEWHHMQGLGAVSHAYFCHDSTALKRTVASLLKFDSRVSPNEARMQTDWFCKRTDYEEEIAKILNSILN